MNQADIVRQMRVLPEIDPEFESRRRVNFIKWQLRCSGCSVLVLGISGGVDSCTCGRLAQLAVDEMNRDPDAGRGYRFVAVRLPYSVQQDEPDARLALEFIRPDCCLEIDVQCASDALHRTTIAALDTAGLARPNAQAQDYAHGNVKARLRMAAQYELAGLLDGLVLGTDHSAENVTGFYTKYGDGGCDLAPLFGLNKRQIRALARYLGAPSRIIAKTPTADLESNRPGYADERALGLRYDDIDDFLEGRDLAAEVCEKIIRVYLGTQHKRQPIPTVYDMKA